MDKKILKERLNEVENQLRTNAKDVHFFDKLIDEALSLKGQMGVEPMLAYVREEDIVDRIDGGSFEMAYGSQKSVYRTKGGLTIIADNGLGLGQQIMDYVMTMKDTEELSEEQKAIFEMDMNTSVFIYNAPLLTANDVELRYAVGQVVIDYLNKKAEEMNNVEVSEETTEQDREFLATMKAIETLEEANKE